MSRDWDRINAAIDAGLCYICDQPVVEGQPRYGPTQAHYDCENPPNVEPFSIDEVDKIVTRAEKALEEAKTLLRKNGHRVIDDS